ncbi:MAG: hypoxanthine phosphoribosyltransferase [bacterium]
MTFKVLIPECEIAKRVKELALEISRDYKEKTPIIVSILKGSFIFTADLVRALTIRYKVDFLVTSSYGMFTRHTGVVKVLKDLDSTIEGEDVILVDDVVDSGMTLKYLCEMLKLRNPNSLNIAVLLDKQIPRPFELPLKYVGFKIPKKFLVGYGLDWQDMYRGLPYVGYAEIEESK